MKRNGHDASAVRKRRSRCSASKRRHTCIDSSTSTRSDESSSLASTKSERAFREALDSRTVPGAKPAAYSTCEPGSATRHGPVTVTSEAASDRHTAMSLLAPRAVKTPAARPVAYAASSTQLKEAVAVTRGAQQVAARGHVGDDGVMGDSQPCVCGPRRQQFMRDVAGRVTRHLPFNAEQFGGGAIDGMDAWLHSNAVGLQHVRRGIQLLSQEIQGLQSDRAKLVQTVDNTEYAMRIISLHRRELLELQDLQRRIDTVARAGVTSSASTASTSCTPMIACSFAFDNTRVQPRIVKQRSGIHSTTEPSRAQGVGLHHAACTYCAATVQLTITVARSVCGGLANKSTRSNSGRASGSGDEAAHGCDDDDDDDGDGDDDDNHDDDINSGGDDGDDMGAGKRAQRLGKQARDPASPLAGSVTCVVRNIDGISHAKESVIRTLKKSVRTRVDNVLRDQMQTTEARRLQEACVEYCDREADSSRSDMHLLIKLTLPLHVWLSTEWVKRQPVRPLKQHGQKRQSAAQKTSGKQKPTPRLILQQASKRVGTT
jgi:hypothetical protein